MATFTLSECRDRHGEVFDLAAAEPVLLTKQGRPSHVLLSARAYRELTERLTALEDRAFGEASRLALRNESSAGSEAFTAALKKLAHGEA